MRTRKNGWACQRKVDMTITIDNDRKIIQRTVTGELHTERSLKLVREIALAASTHKDYNILMDLRDTESRPEMLDLLAIASECAVLKPEFNNKIAFLIPDKEERGQVARLFKTCMEAQGFRFRQFFDRDAALQWLSPWMASL